MPYYARRLAGSCFWVGHRGQRSRAALSGLPRHGRSCPSLGEVAELRSRAPHAIDWSGMQDVVPLLDAREVHMDSKTARRH